MKKVGLAVLLLSIFALLSAYLLSRQILVPKSEVYLLSIKRLDKNKKFISPNNQYFPSVIVDYIAHGIGSAEGKENNIQILYDVTKNNLYWNIGLTTNESYEDFFDQMSKIQFYLLPLNNHYPKYKYTNDGLFKITLSPADSSLKPFLENKKKINATPRYCLQNSDCFLFKNVFGGVAVSNRYQILGNPAYDEDMQIQYGKNADTTPDKVCNLVYSEPRCENNICTGNKTFGNCWRPRY